MQAAHKYGEPKSAYSLVGRWQLGGAQSRGRFSTKVCPPRSSPGLRSALWFIASECKTTAFAAKYTAKGDEPQWEAGPPNANSTQHNDPCVQRFHMEDLCRTSFGTEIGISAEMPLYYKLEKSAKIIQKGLRLLYLYHRTPLQRGRAAASGRVSAQLTHHPTCTAS